MGIDEVPALNAGLQTLDPQSASRIRLDPSRAESPKRLRVVEGWLRIPACPLVEVQRLDIGHGGRIPHQDIEREKCRAALRGAVELRLGACSYCLDASSAQCCQCERGKTKSDLVVDILQRLGALSSQANDGRPVSVAEGSL